MPWGGELVLYSMLGVGGCNYDASTGRELGLEIRTGIEIKEKRRKGKELERSTGMERDWEDEQE
jgi:hypothetical protein